MGGARTRASTRTFDQSAEACDDAEGSRAETVWSQGRAEAGSLRGEDNGPEGSVTAFLFGWGSNERSTTSVGPNPAP